MFDVSLKPVVAAGFVLLFMGLPGCGEDDPAQPHPSLYLEQTSPENILTNLQVAYRRREIDEYAKLLADDFRFYLDESTRQQQGLPEFWNRADDIARTGALFEAPNVTDIRISLTFGLPEPANEPDRESWLKIDVIDTFLEIDQAPQTGEPEGTTFRIDGQLQRFFFRKGISAADTAASSPTAGLYYLVEWIDFGQGNSAVRSLAVEPSTWSSIKSAYN